ncbi:MAG: amidohydrolase family protein [Gemmatimonadaceae bacterium]
MPLNRLACLVLLALAPPAWAQRVTPHPIALRFGALADGSGRTIRDAVVVVDGERIVSVGAGTKAIPRGAVVRDLRRYTAIPGLIDAHTHMTYYWDRQPATNPWQQQGARNTAVTVYLAQDNALRTLETGVTTVRDLGARDFTDVAMRELIGRGAFPGPRMFVSGHGLGRLRPTTTNPAPVSVVARARIADPADIPAAVKAQVDGGADVIKMYGSTGSASDVTGVQTFSAGEMRAAVEAAHALGKRIAIHSYGPEGGRDATAAGAESVEHAVDLDDATLADMARRGTTYVPTIDHNRYYAEYRAEFGYTDAQAAALDAYRERNMATARRAFQAGVRFAMGSDAVFTMFGQNTRELAWFVALGMTPAQALATATTHGAALLGMEKELGAIAPGYFADIVAVEGDPLADIRVVIDRVRWVMKGGTVVVDRRVNARPAGARRRGR